MADILKGKVFVVTGVSQGIGAAIVEELVSAGARVVGVSRKPTQESSDSFVFYQADIQNIAHASKAFVLAKKKFGRVDGLVNNAGVFQKKDFLSVTEADWDLILGTNLKALFFWSQEAFRHFNSEAAILNISSLAGLRGYQKFLGYSPYVASKFGVVGLTEALAEEGREKNIFINGIAPGAIDTAMVKLWDPSISVATKPQAVARLASRVLASSFDSGLTGSVIEFPTAM